MTGEGEDLVIDWDFFRRPVAVEARAPEHCDFSADDGNPMTADAFRFVLPKDHVESKVWR
jgi:hypothetical protein